MPTEIRDNQSNEIVGIPGSFTAWTQYVLPSPQGNSWQFVQGEIRAATGVSGFTILPFTPMQEVRFSNVLWDRLDRLSTQTPDPVADEDDDL